MIRLYILLFLLVPLFTASYAQQPSDPVSLTNVTDEGLLLKEGWRFRAGDTPNGASPQLDDRDWSPIDPTQDLRDLPQLQQARISWLRLHLTTGPDLPPLVMLVFQSVASEVYLDGRLLYRFGTVSTNPDSALAYNPDAAFNLPLRPATEHVLALRIADQPELVNYRNQLNWDSAALLLRLFPTTTIPAVRPIAQQAAYLDTFKTGIAFILFILHLSLFLAYRRQQANGYAAGMYLLLGLAFWAKTTISLTHSIPTRVVLHYVSTLDAWVPGVAILIFYSLFNFRKGWLFWLAIGSTTIRNLPLSADYQWLYLVCTYYLQIELIRIAVLATRRRLLGASIVRVGVLCNLAIWLTFTMTSFIHIPFGGNEWFFHTLFVVAFLCIPLTLSLRLALEHGWVNRQLVARLQEVETLSARNLAQQQERQQLLAQQNEQLEQQVAERTLKLHQQASQLRELDGVKTRFFSNITHEFRTPLTLIISPVEKLLQENRFDRPLLTTIQRNADQLLRLVNQLLDLSKLESNFMVVSLRQGHVPEFVGQVVEVFRRSAEQKGIALTCALLDFPAQEHLFDADKWEKILTNLLSNALKFTPTGGQVALSIKPVPPMGELTAVQIEIADSGIGIVAEKLPHIFDRFYQADTSSTRTFDGSGIGLALVKELVDLLGGTITVASQSGVGTTFRLTLPVASVTGAVDAPRLSLPEPSQPTPETQPSPVSASMNGHSAEGQPLPRVLIVEDNEELRDFLVAELSDSYHVLQAADGQAGWELVQTELPDLVLTDVMMPRMDGHELTRLIKTNTDTDHIAVVMLTAKSARQSRIEGLQQGADDYLPKPFNVEELHLRLANLISYQQKLGEHYRQQFSLPQSLPAPAVAVDPFLDRIYGLLDSHLDNPSLGVDWLAEQLAMSRKTLYRKVQSVIQLAPNDLIRQYRLRRAAELLRAGHPVSETADLVGFSTASYFSLVFREFYQQTPSEFVASRVV
ncbi:MAG: response regulator [Rudanella sp.]|nr:response regulator [Rudanella sp.]